ncbi:unnamed protein product [Effrenium voratum]|uniref:Uncharacterized protein n=1 Tax=Effrenium voratum TaxID=2562239 RepID=A0AA36I3Z6_9DINO|nr:unnamed protein product [Effrenium voratum]
MQRRLGALASGAEKPSLVASGVMLGAAKDDGGLAVLLFSRAKILQGDLGCAQNDLWAVRLGREGGPEILLRALWKGVTPKGRLLCAPVNQAASEYLESHRSRRLCTTSLTLCCGAFGELLQVGALRADPKRAAVLQSTSPASASLPELPELQGLSEEQREVARRVAAWCDGAQGCVPVRGVFGSGKSRTLAACIVLLDRLLSERKDPRRIVLLCQTNVAVDGVLLRLLNHGWDRFARLGSFKAMAPQLLSCGAGLAKERKALVKDFSEALKHQVGLDEPTAQALRQSVERGELPPRPSVWRKRRVLATTLAALEAADHLGEALRCPLVLVDEAAQLTEPQLFAALSRVSAECVLLLGDPRQLPPRAAHSSLQLSALARLPPQLELTTQFRCHPDIGELCSQLFYGGRLKSGVSKEARGSVLGPNHSALAVVLSQGLECRVGQSFRHDAEARLCTAWLLQARASSLRAQDFGIICLYRAHAEACASAARAGDLQVEAATVDAFQGGEREVIALCCGRSSPVSGDSFTCCPFRLLVALCQPWSRARRHVVIFGTESFLSSHPIFSQILAFAAAKGAVVRP